MTVSPSPTRRSEHGHLLNEEFEDIYDLLSKLNIGDFRLIYSDGSLYLQKKDGDSKAFSSVAKIDADGNLSVTGTVTPSATIENPGRS